MATAISREDMLELPVRRYDGDVCVVSTPRDLERARADLLAEGVVGFDTETRPAFTKGEVHLPCLVQAATARTVYLFQLQKSDYSGVVAELLTAHGIVKAGVALAGDMRQLRQLFPFEEKSVLDLGLVAKGRGFEQTGVRNLAGIFMRYRIPKGTRTSNWATSRLSSAQITYAATDAWVCRELYLRFHALGMVSTG